MALEYAKAFYNSQEWRNTRNAYYNFVRGQCERCLNEFNQGKRSLEDMQPGIIVHHKIHLTPKNINNPEISLSFKNLELLCDLHHNRHHKGKQKRYSFDEAGNIIKNEGYEE